MKMVKCMTLELINSLETTSTEICHSFIKLEYFMSTLVSYKKLVHVTFGTHFFITFFDSVQSEVSVVH